MLQTFTLKNGLKVATYSLPHLKSAALDINVKSGGIFETSKNAGVSHLMEHLLVQGTPSFPTPYIFSEFIESLAGSYNAFTTDSTVSFVANAPVTKIDELLRVASEVFFQPLFTSEYLEKERIAILQENKQSQDSLYFKIGKFYREKRYKKGHPYLLDEQSQLEAIPQLKREDLIEWWKRYFLTENTYLVVVGGFKDAQVKTLIEKYFSNITAPGSFEGFPKLTNENFTGKEVFIREDKDLKSCYVDLSWPSLSLETDVKLRMTQAIIRNILGGMFTSRLFKLLRLEKGLVYSVHAGMGISFGFGNFSISTQVVPENLDEVLDLIVKELDQFIKSGPTKEELEFFRSYAINRHLMSWDHPSSIAGSIKSDLMWEDKIVVPEERVKEVQKIASKDLFEVMEKYWDFSKLQLVIQGPIEDSKENIKKYEKMISVLR